MTSNLCFVLALCVGQVPGGSTSPYAPSNVQPGYSYSVTVPVSQAPVRLTNKGPLRSWLQGIAPQKAQAPIDYPQPAQTTASPYVTVPPSPYAPATSTQPLPRYYPVGTGKAVPVTTQSDSTAPSIKASTSVPVYEESSVPQAYQLQPQIIHTEEGVIHEVEQPQPGETVIIDGHVTVPGQVPADQTQELQVAKKYEKQVGHEHDYSWITGHLFYVHANGGCWVVRYSLPGEIDKFGGSVILAPGVEMKNYREGDLVCVYGEILNEKRTSTLGGALYRVNSILMIERAD